MVVVVKLSATVPRRIPVKEKDARRKLARRIFFLALHLLSHYSSR